MTQATIVNVSEKLIPSKSYDAEELLGLLMKVLNYDIEIEEFKKDEVDLLMQKSKIDKISKLVD